MDNLHDRKLLKLVVASTLALLAILLISLFIFDMEISGGLGLWIISAAATAATLVVMVVLHGELQRFFHAKSESEQKAHQDARVDSLTGIGNRKYITEKLDDVCLNASEQPEHALLLIDLKGFKQVNDTLGHQYGDALITAVAHRLAEWMSDSELGRLGGDEFAIIVKAKDEQELEEVCKHVSQVFTEPFKLPGGPRAARGSIGACLINSHSSSSDSLWHSDLALYDAKESGKAFRIFDEAMSKLEDRTKRLKADLENSLKTGAGLFVEYQPIITRTGRVGSMEAFLRWQHEELGLIRPLEIVAIAEKSQLIAGVERFVARQVIEIAKLHTNIRFCLNVSGLQLVDDQFVKWLDTTARANGVSPRQFIIEVRESAINERLPQFTAAFALLGRMGCKIAVDNFEEGGTSMAELGRKGVSIVKIDRIQLLKAQEQQNISVLRASVELAKTLNMTVVATGIDSAHLESVARQTGFDWVQGNHFGECAEMPSLTSMKAAA